MRRRLRAWPRMSMDQWRRNVRMQRGVLHGKRYVLSKKQPPTSMRIEQYDVQLRVQYGSLEMYEPPVGIVQEVRRRMSK